VLRTLTLLIVPSAEADSDTEIDDMDASLKARSTRNNAADLDASLKARST
jgi:hypothetical protein